MQRNQRIQTTATHLRRIYQSGVAVAMRVGAIRRHHANAMAKIGKAVGNGWDEAVRLAQSMTYTPPLAELATAGNHIGLPPARHATPARYSRTDGSGRAYLAGAAGRWLACRGREMTTPASSEIEGDRREADAEAKAARFEAAHDQAWCEMQTASPASAREIFDRIAALKGDKVAGLMADALRKLTAFPTWDSAANKAAVCAVRELLWLAADEKARLEVKND